MLRQKETSDTPSISPPVTGPRDKGRGKSWTGGGGSVGGGAGGGVKPGGNGTPVETINPINPVDRGGRVDRIKPTELGGDRGGSIDRRNFDRPITRVRDPIAAAPAPRADWQGRDSWRANDSRRRNDGWRGNDSWRGHDSWRGGGDRFFTGVTFGIGTGLGFSVGHSWGHGFINFSFGDTWGNYGAWAYPGYNWYRPYHHRAALYDPYWSCDPWGGPYYSRPACNWLVNFSYGNTPCETFTDCGLISPSVIVVPFQPTWSAVNAYPICSDVPTSPATVYVQALPSPASDAELANTTDRELADTYFKLGDTASALRVYQRHVGRHPGDVLAVRSMGFAMIDLGDTENGVRQVERAYRIDPTLARAPFDRQQLRDADTFGDTLDRVTALAGKLDSKPEASAAWLTVAVMMQADGRNEPARSALDKAKEAGLNTKVVEELGAATPLENRQP